MFPEYSRNIPRMSVSKIFQRYIGKSKALVITYFYLWRLNFHENIRFSKTHSEYLEQPYPRKKATIVFLHPPKKCTNIRRIFMEHSGNNPIFNIPQTLFSNIPQNFTGNFFWIFREYVMGMFHEYSTNIYLPDELRLSLK